MESIVHNIMLVIVACGTIPYWLVSILSAYMTAGDGTLRDDERQTILIICFIVATIMYSIGVYVLLNVSHWIFG